MKKKISPVLLAGVVLTVLVLAFSLVGTFYTPFDPTEMGAGARYAAPSLSHPMGTDNFGRDLLSRVMEGAGTSFSIALAVVAIGAGIGVTAGAVSGYFGGVADTLLSRLGDAMTAFPSILLALVIVGVIGPGKRSVIPALGIVFIPSFARVSASAFRTLKTRPYVLAAKNWGVGPMRLLFRHLLPNALPSILPALTIGFNNAVLAEAGLGFLGVGVTPPDASLGLMLAEAQGMLAVAPWYAISVGAVIVLAVFGVGLIGEGLRE